MFLSKRSGSFFRRLAPDLLNLLEIHQHGVVVLPHAAGVPIDDLPEIGDLVANLDDLVHLLLVLAHDIDRVRILEDVLNLRRGHVRIEADDLGPRRQGRVLGPEKLGLVFTADTDRLGRAGAPTPVRAVMKIPNVIPDLLPGQGLPDTVVLAGHEDFVGILPGPLFEQGRQGLGLHLGHDAGVVINCPSSSLSLL